MQSVELDIKNQKVTIAGSVDAKEIVKKLENVVKVQGGQTDTSKSGGKTKEVGDDMINSTKLFNNLLCINGARNAIVTFSFFIAKQLVDRPKDWDKHLTAALWDYRTSFKVSMQLTHFHLVYGQEVILPIEVELSSLRLLEGRQGQPKEWLKQRILDLQRLELDREVAMDYYIKQDIQQHDKINKKRKEKDLEEGMIVLRYDNRLDNEHGAKFQKHWEGPFFIFQKFKNGSYILEDISGRVHKTPVNGWRLKPCLRRANPLAIDRDLLLKEENYEGMLVPFGLGEAPSNFQNALAICNHYANTNEEPHDEGPLASCKGT